MKRVLWPELHFEPATNLQGIGRLREKTICDQVIEKIPPILDVSRNVDERLQSMGYDRLVCARIETDSVRRKADRLFVAVPHTVFDLDAHG